MDTLILLVIFGIFSSVFATQNTTNISIILFGYPLKEVPIYIIVSGSLLLGLFLSFIINFINSIFTSFRMHGKDIKIKQTNKTVVDLNKRNRELEMEIVKLRERSKTLEEKNGR